MKKKKIVSVLSFILCIMLLLGQLPQSITAQDVSADSTVANVSEIYTAPVDKQSIRAFVTRLYDVCLGRTPDSSGLDDWSNKLIDKKATGISVAYGFVFSSEFQNKGYSNEQYIRLMYAAFFGREADQGGLNDWLSRMNTGMTREQLFAGFANSVEFYNLCSGYGIVRGDYFVGKDVNQTAQVNLFVERLYNVILDRSCDKDGMTDWTSKLVNKTLSGTQVAYGFVFSQEFISKNLYNDDFVEYLYNAFMGRGSDSAGKANWVGQLDAGANRESVFNGFAMSQEFKGICNAYGINQGSPVSVSGAGTRGPSRNIIATPTPSSIRGFTEKPIVPVTDSGYAVQIASWNEEFPSLVSRYWGNGYYYTTVESNTYQNWLDRVFASGENAPDIFVADADYARKYLDSNNTLAINDLGIAYSELSEMFNYTLQFAADSNKVIKGLAWQACPCGVFYNRTLAQRYLGVSSPSAVAPYFASWDAFLNTARTVNSASNGTVKIVSGTDEIWRSFIGSRTSAWIVNNQLVVDPVMENYFDLAQSLYSEDLTFEAGQWSDEWTSRMSDSSVLSYWGPMWFLNYCMGFPTNPTTGDWGLVRAPGDYFWGGTWMMASKYCDTKASCAAIMRALALNETNLRNMVYTGEFVNNVSVMRSFASNSSFTSDYLSGQNPASVLIASAQGIDYSICGNYDQAINDEFNNAVNAYLSGQYRSSSDAISAFKRQVYQLGIL